MDRQNISLPYQHGKQTLSQPRECMPLIEEPDALRNQFRSLSARCTLQQQQNGQKLRFGMCPDHIGASSGFRVAPGMDQIESEYRSNPETKKSCRHGFLAILRMRQSASHRIRTIITVGQRLVDAEDLAFFPATFPGLSAEAMGKMNENLDCVLRQNADPFDRN